MPDINKIVELGAVFALSAFVLWLVLAKMLPRLMATFQKEIKEEREFAEESLNKLTGEWQKTRTDFHADAKEIKAGLNHVVDAVKENTQVIKEHHGPDGES